MSTTIQTIIVGIILVITVVYIIYKIVNMVRARKEPGSPCCGCDKPCRSRKINDGECKK